MAEVVDWSPVDDDNNSAPPVGAPEGMMPSGVNNTMRAMMGSLRRMYDNIVSGTTSLPYLLLSGGTVSGNVAINGTGGVALSGVQLRNISNGLEVKHASGGGIASQGAGAMLYFGDRDQVSAGWLWYALGGTARLNGGGADLVAVTPSGAMSVATSVETDAYQIQSTLFAQRSGDNAHLIYDADGQIALGLYGAAGGQVSLYRADSHQFQNNSAGGTVTINNAGDLHAARHISTGTGGNITSNGSLSVASTISSGGNVTAGGQVTGAVVVSTGAMSASGNITAGGQITGALLVSTNDISATDAISAGGAIVGNTVHANTTLSAGTSVAAPTIAASGTLSGGNISSSNNISATSGTVTAAQLTSTGNITATGSLNSTGGNLFIAGNGEINGTLAVGGTVFATGFVDTNGLFSVVDELKALIARVAVLETQARGVTHV